MMTVTSKVHFKRRADRTLAIAIPPAEAKPLPIVRVPRVARLMALAVHFDRMIRNGTVCDQSELARLVHVTQPRLTQIMNLNHLSPDIQACILDLTSDHDSIHERALRPIAALIDWQQQRQAFQRLTQSR